MTSGTNVQKVVQCPECGAANDEGRSKCWLCGAEVAAGKWSAPSAAHVPPQFGLSSLLLIMTLICVCLGLVSIAPGLIVPLVVLVVPALVRTMSASKRWTRQGKQMTIGEKFGAFFTSLGIVYLITVAGQIAFAAACLAGLGVLTVAPSGNQGRTEITIAIVFSAIGGIGALALMVWLFKKTWPGKQ
jgi:hypothetical protein